MGREEEKDEKVPSPQSINLNNITDFIQGHFLYWGGAKSKTVKEQAEQRAILCSPCTQAGKCVSCGCKTPQLYFATNRSCSKQKWGPMLSTEEWEEYKESHPLWRSKALNDYLTTESNNNDHPHVDNDI